MHGIFTGNLDLWEALTMAETPKHHFDGVTKAYVPMTERVVETPFDAPVCALCGDAIDTPECREYRHGVKVWFAHHDGSQHCV